MRKIKQAKCRSKTSKEGNERKTSTSYKSNKNFWWSQSPSKNVQRSFTKHKESERGGVSNCTVIVLQSRLESTTMRHGIGSSWSTAAMSPAGVQWWAEGGTCQLDKDSAGNLSPNSHPTAEQYWKITNSRGPSQRVSVSILHALYFYLVCTHAQYVFSKWCRLLMLMHAILVPNFVCFCLFCFKAVPWPWLMIGFYESIYKCLESINDWKPFTVWGAKCLSPQTQEERDIYSVDRQPLLSRIIQENWFNVWFTTLSNFSDTVIIPAFKIAICGIT